MGLVERLPPDGIVLVEHNVRPVGVHGGRRGLLLGFSDVLDHPVVADRVEVRRLVQKREIRVVGGVFRNPCGGRIGGNVHVVGLGVISRMAHVNGVLVSAAARV